MRASERQRVPSVEDMNYSIRFIQNRLQVWVFWVEERRDILFVLFYNMFSSRFWFTSWLIGRVDFESFCFCCFPVFFAFFFLCGNLGYKLRCGKMRKTFTHLPPLLSNLGKDLILERECRRDTRILWCL